MPPLPESERRVPLPPYVQPLAARGGNALAALMARARRRGRAASQNARVFAQLLVSLLPALCDRRDHRGRTTASATAPEVAGEHRRPGRGGRRDRRRRQRVGAVERPDRRAGARKPEPGSADRPRTAGAAAGRRSREEARGRGSAGTGGDRGACGRGGERLPAPTWFYVAAGPRHRRHRCSSTGCGAGSGCEVFKLLLTSFFPLALLILAVLGSIVVGLATPAEAARWARSAASCWPRFTASSRHWRERPQRQRPVGAVRRTHGQELRPDHQGIVVPHRQDERDGVLAVRRLGHLLGGVRAARRPGDRSRSGCCRST